MSAQATSGIGVLAQWHGEADVVVVGFGGAGACTALEARQRGADVIVFDRFAGGGATARSGGIVYAGETHIQQALGIRDDTEEMMKYLTRELRGAVSEDLIRTYCRDSAGNIRWLESLGMDYGGSAFLQKADYPPEEASLYFAGNENRADNAKISRPAPRGHRPLGNGLTGVVYFDVLRKAVESHHIRVLVHSPVVGLVRNQAGEVIGIEVNHLPESTWKRRERLYGKVGVRPFNAKKAASVKRELAEMEAKHGVRKFYRARGGVVLSTGGFAENDDMVRAHAPQVASALASIVRLSSLGCDGSGIRLGQLAGGEALNMQNLLISRNIAPKSLRAGMLVNREGRRILNEDAYNGDLGQEISNQPDGKAWLILDRPLTRKVIRDFRSFPKGSFLTFYLPTLLNAVFGGATRAPSLSRLADKCGIDGDGLAGSVAEYNRLVQHPSEDPFRKSPDLFAPIAEGPFLALDYSLGNSFAFNAFFTLGGLAVEESTGQVLDADRHPIRGLYAAGRTSTGLCSRAYVSGLSLGDGLFSGRRAGRHAAQVAAEVTAEAAEEGDCRELRTLINRDSLVRLGPGRRGKDRCM